ncbi:hypothetical protein XELAEV_18046485mg [Xenopus laevis]|uniref:C2 domain-containing protein n=1 Tax=Xenopus laevis TaxID=8355 RepID=A0A974BTC7_XENLA|nr:hypothetical protein XELAEV_18046485mg [Xenopus laevis]
MSMKMKVMSKSLNPQWNEMVKLENMKSGDLHIKVKPIKPSWKNFGSLWFSFEDGAPKEIWIPLSHG